MASAQFGTESLKGLTGVAVLTEPVGLDEARDAGFDSAELRPVIERRLFNSGIGVMSREGALHDERQPVLYLRLSIMKAMPGSYCYGLNLFVLQRASLSGGFEGQVMTWEHGVLGTVVNDEWITLHDIVTGAVDAFVSSFKSVNPVVPGETPTTLN